MASDIICPFCKEKDFDLIGLKYHFEMGYCTVYNDTLTIQEERELNDIKKLVEDGK
jgi:hypothetical protein